MKRDEIEISLFLNTKKTESYQFTVGIESNKNVEYEKTSNTFKTFTGFGFSSKERNKIDKNLYDRFTSESIN